MMELVAGIVVALAALVLVLEPLVRGRPHAVAAVGGLPEDGDIDFTDIEESDSPKVQALLALKEIEFDRETGKLSDGDYAAMKAMYQQAAMHAIEQDDAGLTELPDDAVAVCPACGPRPEATARFCSDCGRVLEVSGSFASCDRCGTPAPPGAKFCGECGSAL